MKLIWTICYDTQSNLTLIEDEHSLEIEDLQLTLTNHGVQVRARVLKSGKGEPIATYREAFITKLDSALVHLVFTAKSAIILAPHKGE